MDKQQIDNAIEHITSLQEKLNSSKNNLQYIKRLQALKRWLQKFDNLLDNASKQQGEYKKVYESYFQPCSGFSFYDRVHYSIVAYQYGEKPFL